MNRDIISLKINIIGFKFLRHLEKYKRSEKKNTFLIKTDMSLFSFFFLVSRLPRGKIRKTFDFLSCKSLGDYVILIFL